ncbi:MAG: polymer-forming cytoskeletal protein [Steroidobacteraceae bacterium]|nr:polymer-forming cytoskeletal protein [Steroidobacteraceae bacterium]
MFGRDSRAQARIDTLIGKAASVQGDVEFEGGLHLDGRVAGNVRAVGPPGASLSVSEHGAIDGSVDVPNVTLNGAVRGDIRAVERIVLGPRARVLGNVHYGVIEMTLGAEIKGKLVPLPSPSAATMEGEAAGKPE